MSEIKLFEVGTVVKERTSSTVVLEKQLQTTIEQNMETFFGVRFLKSEYMITSGRMDSIGIDENNSPVIFEYKRSSSENVINQGLFYLDWLLDHKADFKLLVIEKLGMEVADQIDWSVPCVICIANDFIPLQPFVLWSFHFFCHCSCPFFFAFPTQNLCTIIPGSFGTSDDIYSAPTQMPSSPQNLRSFDKSKTFSIRFKI